MSITHPRFRAVYIFARNICVDFRSMKNIVMIHMFLWRKHKFCQMIAA